MEFEISIYLFLTLEIARCKIKLIMHAKIDIAENLSYNLNADLKKKNFNLDIY